MRNTDFEKNLIEIKKVKFLETVKRSSEFLRTKPPKVKFWDEFCPNDTKKELAHIHVDKRLICVSIHRLQRMDFDQIEEIATHEITHLRDITHKTSFHNLHSEVKTGAWVARRIKDSKVSKKTDKEKKTRIKNLCSYNPCEKKKEVKCKYCKRSFCKKHLKPKQPYLPRFDSQSRENIIRLHQREDVGHPCIPYVLHIEKKNKDDLKRSEEALVNLVKSRRQHPHDYKSSEVYDKEELIDEKTHHTNNYKSNDNNKKKEASEEEFKTTEQTHKPYNTPYKSSIKFYDKRKITIGVIGIFALIIFIIFSNRSTIQIEGLPIITQNHVDYNKVLAYPQDYIGSNISFIGTIDYVSEKYAYSKIRATTDSSGYIDIMITSVTPIIYGEQYRISGTIKTSDSCVCNIEGDMLPVYENGCGNYKTCHSNPPPKYYLEISKLERVSSCGINFVDLPKQNQYGWERALNNNYITTNNCKTSCYLFAKTTAYVVKYLNLGLNSNCDKVYDCFSECQCGIKTC